MDAAHDIAAQMEAIGRRATAAARVLAAASPALKNRALLQLAQLLRTRGDVIAQANRKDLVAADAAGMDAPRMDRLRLTDGVVEAMAKACEDVAAQSDPVGAIETMWKRPNGIMVGKMRIPLGVVAMIFESRPNVTVDSAVLCLKAGNAVILRGGSEAIHSNLALAALLHEALDTVGLPADCAQVVATTDRAAVTALCKMDQYIDVMIPRGGEGLVRAVTQAATMPVLKHYQGVCHCYVDKAADLEQALAIVYNGKCQRPGVCNALEATLVHADVAEAFLPMLAKKLGGMGVEFRACPRALPLLGATAVPAQPADWGQEFHALIMAVKVVDSMDAALDHIAAYGSNHTEVICSRDHDTVMRFLREADASMVAANASSRFNDGGELGLGAEIGISTSKLHAYGPMGATELTSTKFVVLGQGQTRG
ncbi:glutamate-5-semialdehyde dehydrogenase [Megalodesulfovibrio gigas]|uniref:Gamma-glutamyl phosphate reductase n=1 Tax=Megalodesulfovibrio gigas (strain ATCC 19364 / DSM 1382 / NCIMB 9332 / VKM B-1759) TaxID=1121448 RepID=T2G806_MEGG1|nr:glutamate-5-semialdehyde dehydrogenase [Megalodesulfovibrio gigas]AGW12022.1 putative Gamma-glutamyl phosphate reductase [Megalodesulfovibrio gigas DSM 1382 = ATCC 19364]